MILDKELMFSEAQAITTTAASTNVIDLGADHNLGGKVIELFVTTDAAFQSTTTSTLTVALQTDSTSAFSSATALFTSAAINKSALTSNTMQVRVAVPHTTERYLRLNYTVGGADFTAGAVTAGLVLDVENRRDYPDAL